MGSPFCWSWEMASRQVSRQAAPSARQPLFSAPISFMPAQSLTSHHFSSHSTCNGRGARDDTGKLTVINGNGRTPANWLR